MRDDEIRRPPWDDEGASGGKARDFPDAPREDPPNRDIPMDPPEEPRDESDAEAQ
jgi:hypothetical protein